MLADINQRVQNSLPVTHDNNGLTPHPDGEIIAWLLNLVPPAYAQPLFFQDMFYFDFINVFVIVESGGIGALNAI